MINRLSITNFRQFKNISFDFDKNTVIIVGDNTKGKSTILECLYILTNGEAPWGDFDDEFNDSQNIDEKYVRIEGQNGEEKSFVYFRDTKKRQLKIDGSNVSPRKFYENISSVLFSPDQIDLLMISSIKRREFLDKLISSIDMEYAEYISKYNKILKQRNAHLKKLSKIFYETNIFKLDDTQLTYWTKILSEFVVKIMQKRDSIISQLKGEDFEVYYKPSIILNMFEDMAKTDELTEIVFNMIMEKAKRDIALGYTNLGIHRDDWMIFSGKDVKRFGSRGEKRIAIGKLIFLTLELKAEKKNKRPILLLDDIPSELDKANSTYILSNEIIEKQQTFITTLDLSYIPKELIKSSQIIDLNIL